MRHYLFTVIRVTEALSEGYTQRHTASRYTVSVPDEDTDFSLEFYATMLACAERALLPASVRIARVIALEVEDGATFGGLTRAHVFRPLGTEPLNILLYVPGWRGYTPLDLYAGIEVGRNHTEGKVDRAFFPSTLSVYDLRPTKEQFPKKRQVVLRPDTDLTLKNFALFREIMALLPYVDSIARVDSEGNVTEIAPPQGKHLLLHATYKASIKRAQARRAINEWIWQGYVEQAARYSGLAFQSLKYNMNNFSFKWGEGHWPWLEGAVQWIQSAASVWYYLAQMLGMEIPDPLALADRNIASAWGEVPAGPLPRVELIEGEAATIEAIQVLYSVSKWLTGNSLPIQWQSEALAPVLPTRKDQARANYDLFPDLMGAFEAVKNCIAIIQATAVVKLVKKPVAGGIPAPVPDPIWKGPDETFTGPWPEMPFTHFPEDLIWDAGEWVEPGGDVATAYMPMTGEVPLQDISRHIEYDGEENPDHGTVWHLLSDAFKTMVNDAIAVTRHMMGDWSSEPVAAGGRTGAGAPLMSD